MSSFGDGVLLVQAAATLTMTGIIWFVQVVHYPLFRLVGSEGFAAYAAAHGRRTGWVVAVPMVAEVASGVLLLWWRPPGVPGSWVWIGLALLLVIWLSTALLQVPRHRALAAGFEASVGRGLTATNWVRTVAWSLRGLLVLAMVARV